jgi:hypothetical protein
MARKFRKPRADSARLEALEVYFAPPPSPLRFVPFVAETCRFDAKGAHVGGLFHEISAWVAARQSGAGVVVHTLVDPAPEPNDPLPERAPEPESAEVGQSSPRVVDDDRSPGEVRAALWAGQKSQMLEHPSQSTTDHEFQQASRQKRVTCRVIPLFSNPTRRR